LEEGGSTKQTTSLLSPAAFIYGGGWRNTARQIFRFRSGLEHLRMRIESKELLFEDDYTRK
jgi:hypothetical protein